MSKQAVSPTQQTTLQDLMVSLGKNNLSLATTLALELAGQGALPILELFSVTQRLTDGKCTEQAIALYRLWLARTESTLAYAVHFNLAVTLSNMNDDANAEQHYRRALDLNPSFIESYLNLGTLLERRKQPELALATWQQATELMRPGLPANKAFYLQALNNLGRLLEIQKRLPEAEAMLSASLEQDPQQPNVIVHWVHLRQKQCAWPIYRPIAGLSTEALMHSTSALAMLSASDDPAMQLAAARNYVNEKVLRGAPPLSDQHGYGHQILRIGYLSSDFCSHAVSILTAELFELHDRAKMEVYGFCWSRDDGSPIRARVIRGMDQHIRIGQMSDEQAARCIRAHEIDILVDLHGLTLGTRPDILSYRPAPVQITWLGFPGPTGLPSIDYVLADRFVLPPELVPFFTEKPLYLPQTFQVNDRQRPIGPTPSKASCNLPEDGFIFCSFNNNHKFTPEVFRTWMRILQRVPGSVLWLVADSEQVRENLSQAAETEGVARARLIFANRAVPADYLARFQIADLFLDTLPFNGGTTASDALWAGLPLLTCTGKTFASRMAGSLLMATGMPELITYNLQDYEDKAVELGNNPQLIAALKQHLAEHRLDCPLFDSPRFVRDLETLYQQVALGYDSTGERAPAAPPRSAPGLPLVSILIPTHNRPHYFEIALNSALAQTYENCEIIVSDNSDDTSTQEIIQKYLRLYPHIKYYFKQSMSAAGNWGKCLELATGEYINFLMDDDIFAPEKIKRMMHYYINYPETGLVTSFRQLIDAEGRHLPPLPGTECLFPVDTVVTGKSFGDLMLTNGSNMIGEPTTVLIRRSAISAGFGHFLGRQYTVLSDIATWLSILAESDCIYISEPLSYFRLHAEQDQRGNKVKIIASIEWFRLAFDAHKHHQFLDDRAAFLNRLSEKLAGFTVYITSNYAEIRNGGYDIEAIHQIIREGCQILLSE